MIINNEGKLCSEKDGKEVIIKDVEINACFKSLRENENFVFRLDWLANIGFGQLTFIQMNDGTYNCESECMCSNDDKLFIKEVFNKFIEKLNIIE